MVRATCKHFGLKTVPRIAGGWVRDKVLSRPGSHDIDIALDDCTGEEFAKKVNEYLTFLGEPTSSLAVIKANPDKSKHLATATVKVRGYDLDLVNLRSETYEPGSRIPKIEIGTPLQDAERRDFTINALFYNVLTREVEDLTGRGISDLRAGFLKTPLSARITFQDDPLRMLRGIRFASRFGFQMDAEMCAALEDAANAHALETVVSNERVGVEMVMMLSGERPTLALRLIVKHGLAQAVFKVPNERFVSGRPVSPGGSRTHVDWETGMRVAETLFDSDFHVHGNPPLKQRSSDDRAAMFLAAMLYPLADEEVKSKKGKMEPVVKVIVAEALKLSKKVTDSVYDVVTSATELAQFVVPASSTSSSTASSTPTDAEQRLAVGRLLLVTGEAWRSGLELALAIALASREFSRDADVFRAATRERVNRFAHVVFHEWRLDGIWDRLRLDPVLDGRALMTMLNIKGSETKTAVDLVRDFCILNPPGPGEFLLDTDPNLAPGTTRPERAAYVERAKAYVLAEWPKRAPPPPAAPTSPKAGKKKA